MSTDEDVARYLPQMRALLAQLDSEIAASPGDHTIKEMRRDLAGLMTRTPDARVSDETFKVPRAAAEPAPRVAQKPPVVVASQGASRMEFLRNAPAPREAITSAFAAYMDACENPNATQASIGSAHANMIRAIESWVAIAKPAALPCDASALAQMDVRYRADDRGVESVTITATSLDQIEPLTRFVQVMRDAMVIAKEKKLAAPRGVLEIE